MFKGIRGFLYLLVITVLLACLSTASAEGVSLPEQLTVIEAQTFYGDTSVTAAILPEGILEIREQAFAHSSLKTINLPASLQYIADNAFEQTPLTRVSAVWGSYAYHWAVEHGYLRASTDPSLFNYSAPSDGNVWITGFADSSGYPEKIVLPEYSPSGYRITGIGDSAFSGCTSLTSVYIPGNVKTIQPNAFRSCTELTELTLCEGITQLCGTVNYINGAFSYCSKLESVVIPTSMQLIDNCAFYGCSSLTSLTIRDSADVQMSIGREAFRGTSLSGPLTIPAKVSGIGGAAFTGTPITELNIQAGTALSAIGDSAFEGCRSLTSVSIPGNVQTIHSRAFVDCTELTSLSLNEGLVTIGGTVNYVNGAFTNCTKLASVVIPSTVKTIDNCAFYGCSSLTSLTIRDSADVQMSIGREAFRWTSLSGPLTIPAKVSGIGGAAFTGTPITELNIQAGTALSAIGDSAFEGCRSLTSVSIPGNVQTIHARAFVDCTELTSLSLNEGLVTIGGTVNYVNGAFTNCTKLASVVIPSTVKTIDNCAFYGCSSLTSLTIRDSADVQMSIGREAFRWTSLSGPLTIPAKVSTVNSYAFSGTSITELNIQAGTALSAIGDSAFEGCRSLTSVNIPGNVQTIHARAFVDCTELTSLSLNEGLVTIGGTVNYVNGAFTNCTKLASVVIPSTVKTIDNCAFYGCSSLTSLTIRDSADVQMSIGREAFRWTSLSDILTLPAKVSAVNSYAFSGTPITKIALASSDYLTAIGDSAFESCVQLTDINIPGNVQTIGARAFFGCSSLENLILNEGLVTIGGTVNYVNGAFAHCSALTQVVIPSTVRTIDNRAFFGCSALTSLTIRDSADVQLSIGTEAFRETSLADTLTIPAKVSGIGGGSFAGTPITKIALASSDYLTAIGDSAFESCVQLTDINIPGNVQTIGARAFFGCSSLENLTLNEGLVTIGGTVNYVNGAFAHCSALTQVVIPSTVRTIDNRAFFGCSALTSLTIRDSADVQLAIGTEAFRETSLAGTLTIPAKVSGIGGGSFAGIPIDKLTIKEGTALTAIGESAFEGCRNLTTVYIPGNVQTISARAFIDCSSLKYLTFNEGLLTIGGQVNYVNGAFANCISLERIVFPSTINLIYNRAFYNCTSLTEILVKRPVEEVSLGTEVFYNCPGMLVYVE